MRVGRLLLLAPAIILVLAGEGAAQLRKDPGAREAQVATAITREGEQQQTDDETAALDQAVALLARWRHEAARQKLEGTENDPAFATAWGLLLAEEGHPDQAVQRLRQAASDRPGDPAPSYWLGEVLFLSGDLNSATQAWQEAARRAAAILSGAQDDARAAFYLGASKVRLKAFDDARQALDKAAAGGWDTAMVSYQRGLSHAFAQQWQEAIDALSAAIDADPTYAHAWYYRALSWDKVRRTDRMLQDLERFVQLAPDAPEADRARSILAAAGH